MTERDDNLLKTAKTLAQDLHYTDEWDAPSRLYFLTDDDNDPTARYIGKLEGHPTGALRDAYDHGMHPSDKVLGLLVASEGYRHYRLEEIVAEHPTVADGIRERLVTEGRDASDSAFDAHMQDLYKNHVLPLLPPPHDMPPTMRKEVRVVTIVMRDGTCVSCMLTRGLDDFSGGVDKVGTPRVPNHMYQLLHDVRPADCDDPFAAVSAAKSKED